MFESTISALPTRMKGSATIVDGVLGRPHSRAGAAANAGHRGPLLDSPRGPLSAAALHAPTATSDPFTFTSSPSGLREASRIIRRSVDREARVLVSDMDDSASTDGTEHAYRQGLIEQHHQQLHQANRKNVMSAHCDAPRFRRLGPAEAVEDANGLVSDSAPSEQPASSQLQGLVDTCSFFNGDCSSVEPSEDEIQVDKNPVNPRGCLPNRARNRCGRRSHSSETEDFSNFSGSNTSGDDSDFVTEGMTSRIDESTSSSAKAAKAEIHWLRRELAMERMRVQQRQLLVERLAARVDALQSALVPAPTPASTYEESPRKQENILRQQSPPLALPQNNLYVSRDPVSRGTNHAMRVEGDKKTKTKANSPQKQTSQLPRSPLHPQEAAAAGATATASLEEQEQQARLEHVMRWSLGLAHVLLTHKHAVMTTTSALATEEAIERERSHNHHHDQRVKAAAAAATEDIYREHHPDPYYVFTQQQLPNHPPCPASTAATTASSFGSGDPHFIPPFTVAARQGSSNYSFAGLSSSDGTLPNLRSAGPSTPITGANSTTTVIGFIPPYPQQPAPPLHHVSHRQSRAASAALVLGSPTHRYAPTFGGGGRGVAGGMPRTRSATYTAAEASPPPGGSPLVIAAEQLQPPLVFSVPTQAARSLHELQQQHTPRGRDTDRLSEASSVNHYLVGADPSTTLAPAGGTAHSVLEREMRRFEVFHAERANFERFREYPARQQMENEAFDAFMQQVVLHPTQGYVGLLLAQHAASTAITHRAETNAAVAAAEESLRHHHDEQTKGLAVTIETLESERRQLRGLLREQQEECQRLRRLLADSPRATQKDGQVEQQNADDALVFYHNHQTSTDRDATTTIVGLPSTLPSALVAKPLPTSWSGTGTDTCPPSTDAPTAHPSSILMSSSPAIAGLATSPSTGTSPVPRSLSFQQRISQRTISFHLVPTTAEDGGLAASAAEGGSTPAGSPPSASAGRGGHRQATNAFDSVGTTASGVDEMIRVVSPDSLSASANTPHATTTTSSSQPSPRTDVSALCQFYGSMLSLYSRRDSPSSPASSKGGLPSSPDAPNAAATAANENILGFADAYRTTFSSVGGGPLRTLPSFVTVSDFDVDEHPLRGAIAPTRAVAVSAERGHGEQHGDAHSHPHDGVQQTPSETFHPHSTMTYRPSTAGASFYVSSPSQTRNTSFAGASATSVNWGSTAGGVGGAVPPASAWVVPALPAAAALALGALDAAEQLARLELQYRAMLSFAATITAKAVEERTTIALDQQLSSALALLPPRPALHSPRRHSSMDSPRSTHTTQHSIGSIATESRRGSIPSPLSTDALARLTSPRSPFSRHDNHHDGVCDLPKDGEHYDDDDAIEDTAAAMAEVVLHFMCDRERALLDMLLAHTTDLHAAHRFVVVQLSQKQLQPSVTDHRGVSGVPLSAQASLGSSITNSGAIKSVRWLDYPTTATAESALGEVVGARTSGGGATSSIGVGVSSPSGCSATGVVLPSLAVPGILRATSSPNNSKSGDAVPDSEDSSPQPLVSLVSMSSHSSQEQQREGGGGGGGYPHTAHRAALLMEVSVDTPTAPAPPAFSGDAEWWFGQGVDAALALADELLLQMQFDAASAEASALTVAADATPTTAGAAIDVSGALAGFSANWEAAAVPADNNSNNNGAFRHCLAMADTAPPTPMR